MFRETIPKLRSSLFNRDNLWARRYAHKHGQPFVDLEPNTFEEEVRASKYLQQPCLAKLVCVKDPHDPQPGSERVVGLHYLGPNAGEVTQGFALAIQVGVRKSDFDHLVGIHPTAAEEFTMLTTKLDGSDLMKSKGCCG